MKSNITFSFTIIIFICWSMLSKGNDHISLEFPNYINESFEHLCKDEMISLNFSDGMIISIDQNFISSPLITCLYFAGTRIENIKKGAFNKLPNLTRLIFLNNNIDLNKLFDFGSHENLKILILNNVTNHESSTIISGEYPNLEILSIRNNFINDLQTKETPLSDYYFNRFDRTPLNVKKNQTIPFPKLNILDLSGNYIKNTNFIELLPNSLYFLDLHDNLLTSLAFDNKQVNLLALNLDNNNLKYVKKYNDSISNDQYNRHYSYTSYRYDQYNSNNFGLALTGLKNLRYLSISKNKINLIESNTFEDTTKLVYLNLSMNNISYLHSEVFEKLQSLNSLDLSFNKLENVPQISSEVISILSFYCNKIKNLNINSFVQMPKLTKLYLGGNELDEINDKAFAYLSFLEILDLSRNQLSFLPKGLSESLTSLKYLNLYNNKFTSIESLFLTNKLPLMELYLAMNPLKYLNVKYFKNLPQNLTVNLQESNFTYWYFNSCPLE